MRPVGSSVVVACMGSWFRGWLWWSAMLCVCEGCYMRLRKYLVLPEDDLACLNTIYAILHASPYIE